MRKSHRIIRCGVLFFLSWLLTTAPHAATLTFTGSDSPSVDDSVALQTAINQMSAGDTLVINGVSRISTVVLSNKVNLTLQVNGVITSIFIYGDSSGGYSFSPSRNPLFSINGGSNITLRTSAEGYLRNGYAEAVAVAGVSGLTLSANIDGGGKGKWDGIYLYNNTGVTVSNCYIRKTSQMDSTPEPAGPYGHGIELWANANVLISGVSISEVRENGIYLGSSSTGSASPGNHYLNTVITGNYIAANGQSGIQMPFNRLDGNPITDFSIVGNSIWSNRADGIDLNNTYTGGAYDVWGMVSDNRFYNNGFLNGAPTPDGSGVATVIGDNQLQLLNNIAIDMNATGIYVAAASNVTVSGNIVIKRPGTTGMGADAECGNSSELCSNVMFSGNDIYWPPGTAEQDSLRAYIQSGVSVNWLSDYVLGGNIEWILGGTSSYYDSPATPGMAVSAPSAGLTISSTNLAKPNFYRWSKSSSGAALQPTDYIIAYRTDPVFPRFKLVVWTSGAPHTVAVNLANFASDQGGPSPSDPSEQVTVRGIDGSVWVPAPLLTNSVLQIPMGGSPVFVDIP